MDDGCGAPPLCAGADDFIGPPTGLAEGWRLCIATHSRPQCRAGVFARRLGFAASQGFPRRCKHCRPQAAFRSATGTKCRLLARRSPPTKHRAGFCRGLQDTCGAKRQCTPPSPSVTPPLAGEAFGGLPFERLPCKGLRSRAPPAAEKARRSRCSGRRMQACFSMRRVMRAPQTGNGGEAA